MVQVLICTSESIAVAPGAIAQCDRPIIATRVPTSSLGIAAARSACDTLQGELAGIGDFAGYMA